MMSESNNKKCSIEKIAIELVHIAYAHIAHLQIEISQSNDWATATEKKNAVCIQMILRAKLKLGQQMNA